MFRTRLHTGGYHIKSTPSETELPWSNIANTSGGVSLETRFHLQHTIIWENVVAFVVRNSSVALRIRRESIAYRHAQPPDPTFRLLRLHHGMALWLSLRSYAILSSGAGVAPTVWGMIGGWARNGNRGRRCTCLRMRGRHELAVM